MNVLFSSLWSFFFCCKGDEHINEVQNEYTIPTTSIDYARVWDKWEKAKPGEEREVITHRLKECQEREERSLELGNLKVSSLPELPPYITELNISGGCNSLICLPDPLPAGLTTLNIEGGLSLRKLPSPLPAGLTTLVLKDCHNLIELPDPLPAGLTTLDFGNTTRIGLPYQLPAGLTKTTIVLENSAWSWCSEQLPNDTTPLNQHPPWSTKRKVFTPVADSSWIKVKRQ